VLRRSEEDWGIPRRGGSIHSIVALLTEDAIERIDTSQAMKSIMEMHQIKYFLAVCSECNFSRAARLCRVSQPSLTRAIKLLEAEFGGPLFRRTRGRSHLTALGEIVRPHLEKVWQKSEAAITSAREFAATSHLLEVSTPTASIRPVRSCGR
jgi:hypothetical protein